MEMKQKRKQFLIACLFTLPQGQSEPRTVTRRYKPVIQVTEEIDINDITFTTSAPDFDRSSSHKTLNYYNGLKGEGGVKGSSYNRLPDTAPSVFPHVGYKDSYGSVIPVEKIYSTKQPILVPNIKYKPYKLYKVPDGHDGFRPVAYKPSGSDKGKLVIFEAPTTSFSAIGTPQSPKQYSSKVVPFSSQYLKAGKPLVRPTSYPPQENRNFVPSPTYSPTVVASLNNEGSKKYSSDVTETKPFTPEKKESDWEKPKKKTYHVKKAKKVYENHNPQSGDDLPNNPDKVDPISSPSTIHKESPQESETFLSEISTLHKGGNANNLDGAPDSLELKTGERVEFQMYGMDGPQSYKFGYDTGKGHNRHFRFEERDNTGKVKGHYGYLDEDGKMRIMKYEADPVTGFHAGPVEIAPDEN